ncbi:MAG: hypothetical protein IPK25_15810 [Saprospiraceae bacterium]|nr:hypothetical protein [Saprospiraceae bacterium]
MKNIYLWFYESTGLFYGNLPDEKWYWRDELIFFIYETKIQIKLDFCNLEVIVNFIDAKSKEDLINIRNYLFYSIISLYWDHDTLDFAHYSDYLDHKIEKGEVDIDDPLCNQLINYDNLCKNSFCRPTDLFVSIDGIHFINYMKFWDDSIKETVVCSMKDENGKLSSPTTIASEPYKYLFKNKYNDFNIEKVFKIAISYAKEDHSTLIYDYDPIRIL